MDHRYHVRLTWRGRGFLARDSVDVRLSLREAATEHRVSRQTASKWVRRYGEGGVVCAHTFPEKTRSREEPCRLPGRCVTDFDISGSFREVVHAFSMMYVRFRRADKSLVTHVECLVDESRRQERQAMVSGGGRIAWLRREAKK